MEYAKPHPLQNPDGTFDINPSTPRKMKTQKNHLPPRQQPDDILHYERQERLANEQGKARAGHELFYDLNNLNGHKQHTHIVTGPKVMHERNIPDNYSTDYFYKPRRNYMIDPTFTPYVSRGRFSLRKPLSYYAEQLVVYVGLFLALSAVCVFVAQCVNVLFKLNLGW